jgi:NAD-dependent SIR2 family protein deacetylase
MGRADEILGGKIFKDVIQMKNPEYERHDKKIVSFPHRKHWEFYRVSCGQCHHDEYNEPIVDMKIGDNADNCIECHNKPEIVTGKTHEAQLEYHANTIHIACKKCHQKTNKQNRLNPWDQEAAPTRCNQCH